jgi:hypothetical protein
MHHYTPRLLAIRYSIAPFQLSGTVVTQSATNIFGSTPTFTSKQSPRSLTVPPTIARHGAAANGCRNFHHDNNASNRPPTLLYASTSSITHQHNRFGRGIRQMGTMSISNLLSAAQRQYDKNPNIGNKAVLDMMNEVSNDSILLALHLLIPHICSNR